MHHGHYSHRVCVCNQHDTGGFAIPIYLSETVTSLSAVIDIPVTLTFSTKLDPELLYPGLVAIVELWKAPSSLDCAASSEPMQRLFEIG